MSQPIKLIALIKKKPNIGFEEFKKHWIEDHAPLTLKFKNLKGYRINIVTDAYQEIEGELPVDGTAELWWDSVEEMEEDFASPAGAEAFEDAEAHFYRTHIYTSEYILKA